MFANSWRLRLAGSVDGEFNFFSYKWCPFTVVGVSVSHAPSNYAQVGFARTPTIAVVFYLFGLANRILAYHVRVYLIKDHLKVQ